MTKLLEAELLQKVAEVNVQILLTTEKNNQFLKCNEKSKVTEDPENHQGIPVVYKSVQCFFKMII